MARSDYVYVLLVPGLLPVARTVKREMRTWLERHPAEAGNPEAKLYRCHDGYPSAPPGLMSIPDVLAGR